MNILELLVGQLPEPIYFTLFMIFTKKLKNKKFLFTSLMIVEYMFIFNVLPYSIWSHMLYFAITYVILKLLYDKYAQITDVFTLAIASLSMIILNALLFLIIIPLTNNYLLFVIIERTILFGLLFGLKNKLSKIQDVYKKLWNRNDKVKKKIKSTTFRCINVVLFNCMFYLINIGIFLYNILRG